MAKLKAFIHLDYITVKPYFTAKNLIIYGLLTLFLTTMSSNIASGVGVGMMLATLFVSYPFALGDKNNLDALYATLSVNRKTVVLGRYLFTLLLNICAVLFSFLLASAGLFLARLAGFSSGAGGGSNLAAVLVLSGLFLLIQAMQLPLFFKLGYAKAKLFSMLPFVLLMAAYLALMLMQNTSAWLAGAFDTLSGSGLTIPLLLLAMLAIVLASYGLSLRFYKRRTF